MPPPDRGQIAVSSRRTDEGIGIEVADTGVGIDPEDQARIFDEFFQVGSSRAPTGAGVGLGLAIAWREARLLGGDLIVRSVPGRGSTFTLSLPAGVLVA